MPKGVNQIWQAEIPDFANVYNLTNEEKTGIQIFFENRMSIIENQKDEDTKIELLKQLIIELDTHNNQIDDIVKRYKS